MNKKIALVLSSLICLSGCGNNTAKMFSLPEGGNDTHAASEDIANDIYDVTILGLIKSYQELRYGGLIDFKLSQFDLDYGAHVSDEMNNIDKDVSIDISNTSVNANIQANFPYSDRPFQALVEINNLKSKAVIVDDSKKNEFNVKNCSFAAYLDNGVPYLDLSDPNVKDTLSAPLFFIISDVLQYKIKISQINTILALLKGKNAIGGLDIPEVDLPNLDATVFWSIKDVLNYLNPIDNEDRTFMLRSYDDGAFGVQLYSNGNALNDSYGYDLSTEEGDDYSKFNNKSYSNLTLLFDNESHLTSVGCNLNIDYNSKYVYKYISDSGDEFDYDTDVTMKLSTSFSFDVVYGIQNIDFPDFSSYNFVDLSSFFND